MLNIKNNYINFIKYDNYLPSIKLNTIRILN